ncbi:MAG: hypothetical protein HY815_25350, partial [Candidatus Riflebacteria bacterium]|nr:hypothetical protein [Candidatus Riflebacteria bacterium]
SLWIAAFGVGFLAFLVLIGLGSRLFRSGRSSWPAAITVRYETPELIAVEFKTGSPESWGLDRGEPLVQMEKEPGTAHRFTVGVGPGEPVPRLALVSGVTRCELNVPPSPEELVGKLAAVSAKLGRTRGTAIWDLLLVKAKHMKARGQALSLQFAAEVGRHPELIALLDRELDEVARFQNVKNLLDAVRPHVGALLTNDRTPATVRENLLSALLPLDEVDALAGRLQRPPPFDVSTALKPALEVAAGAPRRRPPPDPPFPESARRLFVPGKEKREGVGIYPPAALLPQGSGAIDQMAEEVAAGGAWHLRDVVRSARFPFTDPAPAGPGGRRLHFRCFGLLPQHYLLLTPPGGRVALPVRLPSDAPLSHETYRWVSVTVRGPLARGTGVWHLEHGSAFPEGPWPYYVISLIAADDPR